MNKKKKWLKASMNDDWEFSVYNSLKFILQFDYPTKKKVKKKSIWVNEIYVIYEQEKNNNKNDTNINFYFGFGRAMIFVHFFVFFFFPIHIILIRLLVFHHKIHLTERCIIFAIHIREDLNLRFIQMWFYTSCHKFIAKNRNHL